MMGIRNTFHRCEPLEPRPLLASISGVVFEDNNADGIRSGSDAIMTLRTVYLDTNNNSQPDAGEQSMFSQPAGYTFSGLGAGTYIVRVVVPLQYRQTLPAGDLSYVVTVGSADVITAKDFGLTTTLPNTGSIQGHVFQDADADGVKAVDDQPLPGTKIYADINDNGVLDATEPYVTPDVGGSYKLRAPSGTYKVRAVFPQDYIGSAPAAGYLTYTFKSGLTSLNNNFGAYGFGKVDGFVFNDLDGDGSKSAAEPYLPGRTLYADLDLDGVFDPEEPSIVTSAAGTFSLSLRPGTYTVRQFVPAGWVQTSPASDRVYNVKSGIGNLPQGWGTQLLFTHPVASAGESYEVVEGGDVLLSGAAESPVGRAIVAYEWDFDYDFSSFDVDASGAAPHFSAAAIDGPASRLVALRVRDSAGEVSDVSYAQVNVIDPSPAVVSAQFNYAGMPQSLTVQFTEDVGANLASSSFAIADRRTGAYVTEPSLTYDSKTKIATLKLAGALPDGDYRLTAWAGGVIDDQGQSLVADFNYDFFVLAGDANHDRHVDFNDLVTLAQNYNTTGKTFPQGDFNYDGAVDFNDLVILAQRYNTSLPLPGASAPAPATSLAADGATAMTPPIAPKPLVTPSKKKADPLFSLTPIAKPLPVKPKAPPARRR